MYSMLSRDMAVGREYGYAGLIGFLASGKI
jgi:hypothetical protein